jgi:hypothetical protein
MCRPPRQNDAMGNSSPGMPVARLSGTASPPAGSRPRQRRLTNRPGRTRRVGRPGREPDQEQILCSASGVG